MIDSRAIIPRGQASAQAQSRAGLRQVRPATGWPPLKVFQRRPETARHLAFKLAKHFVADAPPPALVESLAQVYLKTDGDLRAVTLALIDAPESLAAPATKIRDPWEFVVASACGAGLER